MRGVEAALTAFALWCGSSYCITIIIRLLGYVYLSLSLVSLPQSFQLYLMHLKIAISLWICWSCCLDNISDDSRYGFVLEV